jgi:guanine deaminase
VAADYIEAHLRRAIELAVENVRLGRGGPFGAVVARGEEVVAEGANRVTANHDPTAHAEVEAIRAACRRLGTHQLNDCVVYASCEPCPMCLSAIYWARAERVYFAATKEDAARAGFDDSFIYSEIGMEASRRRIVCQRVAEPDSGQPFALWMASQIKIPY